MTSAIPGIQALLSLATPPAASTPVSSPTTSTTTVFSDLVRPAMVADQDIKAAEIALERVANGDPVEIHEVMIDLERARLSVLTLVQIRNKALEAYQELMRMQV